MYEVLKDVGFIGGIIMAAVAVIIFITEKIPEVIKYYRTVGGRRIAVKTPEGGDLPPAPDGVKLKRLKNGLIRVNYRDKDGNPVKEEVGYEELSALLAKISSERLEKETVTEKLGDKEIITGVMPGGTYEDTPTDINLHAAGKADSDGKTEILEVKTLSSFEDEEKTGVLEKTEALTAEVSAEAFEAATEELTDKNKASRYAESIAEASATEVLPDMRTDDKTEYLN